MSTVKKNLPLQKLHFSKKCLKKEKFYFRFFYLVVNVVSANTVGVHQIRTSLTSTGTAFLKIKVDFWSSLRSLVFHNFENIKLLFKV